MDLAIFDIDGTLIDSNAVDNACFLATFETAFGIPASGTDWSDYQHHTDRGLTHEFLQRAWKRDPVEEEIAKHRAAFIEALHASVARLEEIRGARAFIEFLRGRGWEIALATGAWSESAKLKLAAAGFPPDLPLACCDQFTSREDIVRNAIAGRQCNRIVVFGDGWWDVRAARNLGLPFIGVGIAARGAMESIADFGDPESVLAAMTRL
jgi:beta-phosphoglucomutase-like phosphatase (HAD superfamily)